MTSLIIFVTGSIASCTGVISSFVFPSSACSGTLCTWSTSVTGNATIRIGGINFGTSGMRICDGASHDAIARTPAGLDVNIGTYACSNGSNSILTNGTCATIQSQGITVSDRNADILFYRTSDPTPCTEMVGCDSSGINCLSWYGASYTCDAQVHVDSSSSPAVQYICSTTNALVNTPVAPSIFSNGNPRSGGCGLRAGAIASFSGISTVSPLAYSTSAVSSSASLASSLSSVVSSASASSMVAPLQTAVAAAAALAAASRASQAQAAASSAASLASVARAPPSSSGLAGQAATAAAVAASQAAQASAAAVSASSIGASIQAAAAGTNGAAQLQAATSLEGVAAGALSTAGAASNAAASASAIASAAGGLAAGVVDPSGSSSGGGGGSSTNVGAIVGGVVGGVVALALLALLIACCLIRRRRRRRSADHERVSSVYGGGVGSDYTGLSTDPVHGSRLDDGAFPTTAHPNNIAAYAYRDPAQLQTHQLPSMAQVPPQTAPLSYMAPGQTVAGVGAYASDASEGARRRPSEPRVSEVPFTGPVPPRGPTLEERMAASDARPSLLRPPQPPSEASHMNRFSGGSAESDPFRAN